MFGGFFVVLVLVHLSNFGVVVDVVGFYLFWDKAGRPSPFLVYFVGGFCVLLFGLACL